MDSHSDIRRPALAALAIGVAAVCAGALLFPVERPERTPLEWLPLPAPAVGPADAPAGPASVADLNNAFAAAAYDLKAVRREGIPVPRLFVDALPADFAALAPADRRKRTFFKTVLPLVLKVNEEIGAERARLIELRERLAAGQELPADRRAWLERLARRYDAAPDDLAILLHRVDAVSPALALAQAAEESGWGRSRFALRGNALFGQRVWREGAGIVPHEREEDARYEVRAFASLLDSVRSYALNLNRHPAYADFRARRAEMRAGAERLDPYRLAETLHAYAERGEDYVVALHRILRANRLETLEDTALIGPPFETAQLGHSADR